MRLIIAIALSCVTSGCAVAVSCPPTGCVFGGFAAAINTTVDAPAPTVQAPEAGERK